MAQRRLILGSASRWRRQILQEAGYTFEVMSADIDERAIRQEDPAELALTLAHAKADALLPRIQKPAWLITVDQIVVCNNCVFEKPRSATEVKQFCAAYGKYPAQTVTAVVLTDTVHRLRKSVVDVAHVSFHPIPEDMIDDLIAAGEVFECAGGFQIESTDGRINPCIKTVDGTVDSVKGLPMQVLQRLMSEMEQDVEDRESRSDRSVS